MKCPQCNSDKTYRENAANVDYLWVYSCLKCGYSWLKSKMAAPGILYAATIKREKVKGHYRTVVRNQLGRIITSKKWHSGKRKPVQLRDGKTDGV